jgi:hypothetical protein
MFSGIIDTGIMWTFGCLTVFFLITGHMAGAISISGQGIGTHSQVKRESVDTGNIYDFFTNDVVAQKFFISIILQVSCV